jgi:hypothetical protein
MIAYLDLIMAFIGSLLVIGLSILGYVLTKLIQATDTLTRSVAVLVTKSDMFKDLHDSHEDRLRENDRRMGKVENRVTVLETTKQ